MIEAVMIQIERILYPTDFSDTSLHALLYAKNFAEQYRAKLHCLYVIDEAYQYWMSMGPDSVPAGPVLPDLEASSREQMDRFVAEHLADVPFEVKSEVKIGRPFMEIVRTARNLPADLIVIATHGRSGLSHILLGSVAEKVVRKATCPVITIRHPEYKFEMP
jgi:nucleotide-binding universal stress UspA family protein